MDMIVNKIKHHLSSRGVDNINQLQDIFHVSLLVHVQMALFALLTNLNCRSLT